MKVFFRRIGYQIILLWTLFFCSTAVAQTSEKLSLQGLPAVHRLVRGQAGLKAPVEILRDEWGVNHIYAQNQHDLFFAQGYAGVKDRLFQFELWRRKRADRIIQIAAQNDFPGDFSWRS